MRKLFKDKAFILGFVSGILIFIASNIYASLPKYSGVCFDCYETFGIPFAMHESGTMLHISQFLWAGIIANISIVLVFSFVLGSIFKFILSKISSRGSSLK